VRASSCACRMKAGRAIAPGPHRCMKYTAVPNTASNNRAQMRLASVMRMRRASVQVRCMIVSRPCKASSRPLAVAHDFHEPLLERAAPEAQLVDAQAASDEPRGELRDRALIADSHAQKLVRARNF